MSLENLVNHQTMIQSLGQTLRVDDKLWIACCATMA